MPKEKLFDENTVLQNAMSLFWNKGYNGTSMDELTKVTGLSRSSIYNTYTDKHGLFIRCLQFYQEDQKRILSQAVEKIQSPLGKIKRAFTFLMEDILLDKLQNGCLVVNTTTELGNLDKEIAVFLLQNMAGIEKLFTDWIKTAQQSGEINKTFTAQALARHLYNTYNGLRVIGQTRPEKKTLEDIVKVALSVLEK